jgi:hypothetical protein
MVDNMIQGVYTNSNCSDVFIPFYNQNKKHCKLPLYVISDYDVSVNIDGFYKYSNSDAYYEVWVNAVKQFDSKYFIYLQEDFFLYDDVKEDILETYKNLLENSEYSFVRLLKSGRLGSKMIFNNLYEIESTNENIFSMQATIWKTEDYIKLMNAAKSAGWLETDADYHKIMGELNMNGLYHYGGEPKIGTNHHDSNVYPYIATAVVKGKWNYKEYQHQLGLMLMKYNIDITKRGKL